MADAETARRAIRVLDLTDLNEPSTAAGIEKLCARARQPVPEEPRLHAAAVCVWPAWVPMAKAALAGSGVTVATVVNFPSGGMALGDVVGPTRATLAEGADEIDLVVPWRALLAGDPASVEGACAAIKAVLPAGVPLKAILETGMLHDEVPIRAACRRAIAGGADMLKTSTGKTPVNATLAAARILLEESARAGRPVGVKISGGVRTTADAAGYLALADEARGQGWATAETFRFGASGLLDALISTVKGGAPRASATAY
jgi:deoxyribose-phosphate aldolase